MGDTPDPPFCTPASDCRDVVRATPNRLFCNDVVEQAWSLTSFGIGGRVTGRILTTVASQAASRG
jgi:hypothetical protein